MTDELVGEIERVIFASHSLLDKGGAINFDDMRDAATTRFEAARKRAEQAVADVSDEISAELDKQRQLEPLRGQARQRTSTVASLDADRKKLVTVGSEARVKRLGELTEAADRVRGHIRAWNTRIQAVGVLQDEVKHIRAVGAPTSLAQVKSWHRAAAITDPDWSGFLLDYTGDVDQALTKNAAEAQKNAAAWRGQAVRGNDAAVPIIPDNADLEEETLARRDAEIARIQALVNTDATTAAKYRTVSMKIDEERSALNAVNERIQDAERSTDRLIELRRSRNETYSEIFRSIVQEQRALEGLYAPLTERLAGAAGTVGKLSFSVSRNVNVEGWAAQGELLFDLRGGDFKGRERCVNTLTLPCGEPGRNGTSRL